MGVAVIIVGGGGGGVVVFVEVFVKREGIGGIIC